jgi:YHS domain-containing protein
MKSLFIAILLITGLFFIGCKKQPANAASTAQASQPSSTAAAVEQTTCPVMGNPIDPNVFVEYQGKKVYFCCKQCISEFQKEPEKYLSKLPQFKE